jgi:23S rRNA (adenine2503-C2)-methyltransferase
MNLLDTTPDSWGHKLARLGEPAYRGRQIAHWVFRKQVTDLARMTNLPAPVRSLFQSEFSLTLPTLQTVHQASDGTVKLAIELVDRSIIESVLIPRKGRMTLCLSTQVGCGIGCRFCRTAEMGLIRNLDPSEIVGQWILASRVLSSLEKDPMASDGEASRIDHIVFMGMGEPLANLTALIPAIRSFTHAEGANISPRRVTVSTSGLPPKIRLLGEAGLGVHLAVSLTAPDDRLRQEVMPVGRVYPIREILDACRTFPLKPRERITFEYVLLKGVNDSPDQARALGRLLAPFKSKVNLIPFNPYGGSPYSRPTEEAVATFGEILSLFHLTSTVRKTMGQDIRAACGQLAWDEKTIRTENKGESVLWMPTVSSS